MTCVPEHEHLGAQVSKPVHTANYPTMGSCGVPKIEFLGQSLYGFESIMSSRLWKSKGSWALAIRCYA